MSYFDNWGTKANPIRQSDLVGLFGSAFRCAKRFAMSRYYPKKAKKIPYKMAMGEIVHNILRKRLQFDKTQSVFNEVKAYEEREGIAVDFKDTKLDKIEKYQIMLKEFFKSKEFKSIQRRIIDVERAFMLQIGKFWVAGAIDIIIEGKDQNELVLIDWKTGHPPMTQFQMDNSYQSRIYCAAVHKGIFFLNPDKVRTGEDYAKSFEATHQKNQYGRWPRLIYAYLQEYIPAARQSKRKANHLSTEGMSDKNGSLVIEKGEQRGPIFYETNVNKKLKRLEYSLGCAVALARSGLFPETFGYQCRECIYLDRCESLGDEIKTKQEVMELMDELGIHPD